MKRRLVCLAVMAVALLPVMFGVHGVRAVDNYPGVVKPQVPLALEPLPPGAVEPRGWLRDWALAARHGITGHLDEYHNVFGEGWKAKTIDAPGAQPDGMGWPLEQSAYWLDGALRLGLILHDQELINKVRVRLDAVVSGTLARQTSLIWWKDKSVVTPTKKKTQNFNNWAHSHLARALLAATQGAGDRRALEALAKAYHDYPMADLIGNFQTTYGVVNVDPMLEVYSMTGDARVLESALKIARKPSFRQVCEEKWPDDWADYSTGHGVLFIEQARVPALLYPWTGERWMLDASLKAFDWVERTHMLPCGVPSSEEYLAGIGAFRCIESCDIPCWIWSQASLMRILGEAREGDKIEEAFFNAGPAPVARDWQTMSYYQSPNRISAALPGSLPGAPGKGAKDTSTGTSVTSFMFSRLGYPGVLCCVGNINRLIPFYVSDMWMATPDGGLAAALYGPCEVTARAGKQVGVKLACETAYPFEEEIRIRVNPERAASFPLYFRVPGWCAALEVKVAGKAVRARTDAKGFVRIARKWKKGDTVTLRFPMAVRVERGRETPYPQVPYFIRAGSKVPDVNNPYAAIHYGPLLFALGIPDQDANTPRDGAKWQYALDLDGRGVDAKGKTGEIKVARGPMPDRWAWQFDAPLTLTAPARAFDWKPTDAQPLPKEPVTTTGESTTLKLVPYGCAKFRVSMFPVTERAWLGK